jgi:hypothetical protein
MPIFKTKTKILAIGLILSLLPMFASAQETLQSTHYQIINPEFGNGGGENSTSTHYESNGILSGEDESNQTSGNYTVLSGFIPPAYPGIPGQPTITNAGGIMYNTLNFNISTGGNTSDVNYAIAISTNNFASSTYSYNYVQSNDTIGTTTVWQTYTAWGGAGGQRLVFLLYNTTYYIKVKARYGTNSETGFSLTSSAATVSPTLSVSISGMNSGVSVAGQTTNATSTATSVPFTNLQQGSIKVAAQGIQVSTNADDGYEVGMLESHDLSNQTGVTIAPVAATNASPAIWPLTVNTGAFGYHTTDASLCTGNPTRFASNNTYAAATTTPGEVACNTGPASNDSYNVVFQVEVGALQATGNYSNSITYIVTGQY